MGLTKCVQESTEQEPLSQAQQIEALRKNLTKADLERICVKHGISRPTYYRAINAFDLSNPVLVDIVNAAKANKAAAESRARQASAGMKKLL